MKKVFGLLFVSGLFAFASCTAEETTTETEATETTVEEPIVEEVDTTAAAPLDTTATTDTTVVL